MALTSRELIKGTTGAGDAAQVLYGAYKDMSLLGDEIGTAVASCCITRRIDGVKHETIKLYSSYPEPELVTKNCEYRHR